MASRKRKKSGFRTEE